MRFEELVEKLRGLKLKVIINSDEIYIHKNINDTILVHTAFRIKLDFTASNGEQYLHVEGVLAIDSNHVLNQVEQLVKRTCVYSLGDGKFAVFITTWGTAKEIYNVLTELLNLVVKLI